MKIGNSEIEKMFTAYKKGTQGKSGKQTDGYLSNTILGDPRYEDRFKMPKWNIMPNMLMEPKIAIRYNTSVGISLSKAAHRQRAEHFEGLSGRFETAYQSLIASALKAHGDGNGVAISGIYRSHFPEDVKDRLRFLAHGKSMLTDAVRLHKHLSVTRSPIFS